MENRSFKDILKEVVLFCLPLIAGQIGQMLFGIGDIMVAGRYSNEVVSALGISNGIFAPFLMFGLGVCYAVGPIAAQIRGEGKEEQDVLPSSLLASLITGVALWVLMIILLSQIHFLKLAPEIESLVVVYLEICSISMIPILIYQVLKEYLQAFDNTFFANATIIVFNISNVLVNMVLMFGMGPFPELGIKGAAIATLLNRAAMAIVLGFYAVRFHPVHWSECLHKLKAVFQLGIPIALGTLTEVLVFSSVTVLIGKMSVLASASHNIVLNLASLTFMVPLAVSSASAVKVGEQFGKKDGHMIHQYAKASLIISFIFMSITASAYLGIPRILLRFATDDIQVLNYAAGLLLWVGIFQIPDGIQVTFWGILRGIGVTKTPMVLSLTFNWLVGLPFGYFLATNMNMEASGYWAGLSAGLYLMSFGMILTYWKKYNRLPFLKENKTEVG